MSKKKRPKHGPTLPVEPPFDITVPKGKKKKKKKPAK
jgi:hypothetical protein